MFLGSRARPVRRAENLAAICEPVVWTMWDPHNLTTIQAFPACYGDSFTFTSFICTSFLRYITVIFYLSLYLFMSVPAFCQRFQFLHHSALVIPISALVFLNTLTLQIYYH
jgi:hypothetical protein